MEPKLELLYEWYCAWQATQTNAVLLLKYPGNDWIGELCNAKMQALGLTEELLNQVKDKYVEAYIQAGKDNACPACLLSSAGSLHTACEQKLQHYRRTHTRLIAHCHVLFGATTYVKPRTASHFTKTE